MKNPFQKPDPTPEAPALEESVAQIMDSLDVLRSAVNGYKTKLEADGYSPAMAEQMAATLHSVMIAKAFGYGTVSE